MTNQELQVAIDKCVTELRDKDLNAYVRASLEPHLVVLLLAQKERAKKETD